MIELQRQAMIASAGSGKTYQLSGRYIRLLALGIEPGLIFASTFTRKAAGEILGRVLKRLADASTDANMATELAKQTDIPTLDSKACGELLAKLARQLHRLNIGTLDRFFNRAAACFSLELGMGAGWSIADAAHIEQLKLEAINIVLEQDQGSAALIWLRAIASADADRRVVESITDYIKTAHSVYRQAAADAWEAIKPQPGRLLDDRMLEQLVHQADQVEIPLNKGGTPNANWRKTIPKIKHLLWNRDFETIVGETIIKKTAAGEEYSGCAATSSAQGWLKEVIRHSVGALVVKLAARSKAMHELAGAYGRALWQAKLRAGRFEFDDITMALAGDQPLTANEDVYYRLDGRLQHILLDEFQDTSVEQWQVLGPLIDEAAQSDGDRELLLVADPKQSIYGWRGGEPRLVNALVDYYQLQTKPLSQSWRTAQPVLDVVNEVFSTIDAHPALAGFAEQAAQWKTSFNPHVAARKDRPGYVRLDAIPIDSGQAGFDAALATHAAQLVAQLTTDAPGFSIGVLLRDNKAVTRMIFELGRLGVAASDEGGNRLTDSPAVTVALALLTLADHPGDTLTRYLVSHTSMGQAVGLGPQATDAEVHRTSRDVRRQLLTDGYGPTLSAWAQALAGSCDQRDMQRLLQLVEMGWEYESTATLRPSDFVQRVRDTRAHAAGPVAVRVMTIHASKGLEFDAVVLPQLGYAFDSGRATILYDRVAPTDPITAICPKPPKGLAALCPPVQAIAHAHQSRQISDGLSTLYVAMTRARYALLMLVGDKSLSGKTLNAAKIICQRLGGPEEAKLAEPECLYELGESKWMKDPHAKPGVAVSTHRPTPLQPRLGKLVGSRALARRTPSQAEGGDQIDLAQTLRLDRAGQSRGSLMHALFEQVQWLDDGPPSADVLHDAITDRAERALADELIGSFHRAIGQGEIADALGRNAYPADVELSVQRERRFAVADEDGLLEGTFDRLVIQCADGQVVAAEILDYKTDVAPIQSIVEHYQPQIEAYRGAVERIYRLSPERIAAKLVLLHHGRVVSM